MPVFSAIGLALSATTIGLNASGALDPTQPNLAQSSAQMAETEANLLPAILAEEAAAQEGVPLNTSYISQGQQKQQQKLSNEIAKTQTQLAAAQKGGNKLAIDNLQGKLAQQQQQLAAIKGTPITGNFTGESTAQIQGNIEKQLAAGQEALQAQYDPQFIAQALAEEKQANPQGVAARATENQIIQNQIANPQTNPLANAMESQIEGRINAGSNLTPQEEQMLASTIAQANASGAGASTTGYKDALTGGLAGTQRALSNAGAGEAFLSSGETPQDISYQQQQQNMANLANYISGKTPQSQFNTLQNASQGATPQSNSAVLSTLPGNAQSLGSAGALNQYQAELGQTSPWLAGLSAAIGGANLGASLTR